MKIDIEHIDFKNFSKKSDIMCGEVVHLVIPNHIGTVWTTENLHFRSSMWNDSGELISAGFPKFFNWDESPSVCPAPTSLKNATIVEKMDGSCFIVSKYNGTYILRTRGTMDATKMENGNEVEIFKTNYLPKCEQYDSSETWNFSLIFEWLSSSNVIIITYPDCPRWTLIGGIYHNDYSLFTQSSLDEIGNVYGFERPIRYTFDTIPNLLTAIGNLKGSEGVVVYYKNDSVMKKCKGEWYLHLHHLKSELSSIEKVMDVWLYNGRPSYSEFYNYIATQFDYEIAEKVRGHISNICDAYKEVQRIIDGMHNFITHTVMPLKTRKEQALKIISAYGDTNRASYLFNILDGNELIDDHYKKLMFQVMK